MSNTPEQNKAEIPQEAIVPVIGFEGYYVVSSFGYVNSVDRSVETKFGVIRFYRGKRIIPSITCWGRPIIRMTIGGCRSTFQLCRIVGLNFIPNPEKKPTINHKDGNYLNNHVDNLEWATYAENIYHAVNTGLLKVRGQDNHFAKLKNKDIPKIRKLLEGGLKKSAIAEKFGVCYGTIYSIEKNTSWKNI